MTSLKYKTSEILDKEKKTQHNQCWTSADSRVIISVSASMSSSTSSNNSSSVIEKSIDFEWELFKDFEQLEAFNFKTK